MQIREGKYYRTRGGDVFGPMLLSSDNIWPWTVCAVTKRPCGAPINSLRWTPEGVAIDLTGPNHRDLISEVYVSDTPPADAPAPEVKTLRDELEEKAALAILSGYYANPTLGPSKDPFGDVWCAAKEFVEARKK
jgi:hypothetical protein